MSRRRKPLSPEKLEEIRREATAPRVKRTLRCGHEGWIADCLDPTQRDCWTCIGVEPSHTSRMWTAKVSNEEALRILEDALARCEKENMQTGDVHIALKHLAPQSQPLKDEKRGSHGRGPQWPFHQFWKSLEVHADELRVHAVGRWQMVNAALNGIRLRVPAA